MALSVHFRSRDFSSPILPNLHADPVRLSWSAFGGPDQATVRLTGQAETLLSMTRLLRCPVTVNDPAGEAVWWGFVDRVTVYIDQVEIRVSMETLFNRVGVKYSFVSPDGRLAELSHTLTADNAASQAEYGIKEKVLHRAGIDDDFAASLRDTFLSQHSWPSSRLSQREGAAGDQVLLHCSGWFKTLAWVPYVYEHGFAANYGPGPGVFSFGDTASAQMVCQGFYHQGGGFLKHAYFMLRNHGASRNLTARLYSHSGYSPDTLLSTSSPVAAATLSANAHSWVRFTFPTPYALPTANTFFLIALYPSGVNPSEYFSIRSDENESFPNAAARVYNGTSWVFLPSVTNPGGRPDLYFRIITTRDTGDQLAAIAAAGNQFFTKVAALTTGVYTAPYTPMGEDCLAEAEKLMHLGTSNQRLVLAKVTRERQLSFYEQPEQEIPAVYLNRQGCFFSRHGVALKPYFPPVGQFAQLSGSDRTSRPWDMHRVPLCFIQRAVYFPATGALQIKTA